MADFLVTYLVVGSNGMLGTHLMKLLSELDVQSAGMDIQEVDISRISSVLEAVDSKRPRTIINCAAITDVDGCETEPERAFSVNARGPENLAKACLKFGCSMLHVSTDYVFDGLKDSPYREDDPISPLGIYAKSKAEGEERVRQLLAENHCIVRTQWLFGLYGKNFVEAVLEKARRGQVLRVVNDQQGSPTYAADLASALIALCEIRGRGTFHVTNSGQTTWDGFACAITRKAGFNHVEVQAMNTSELDRPAPRPLYSVLDNSRYVAVIGAPLRPWEEALGEYLKERSQVRIAPEITLP